MAWLITLYQTTNCNSAIELNLKGLSYRMDPLGTAAKTRHHTGTIKTNLIQAHGAPAKKVHRKTKQYSALQQLFEVIQLHD